MNRKISILLFLLSLTMLLGQNVFAGNIQDRMKDRLPVIAELKKAGNIGENHLGYLEHIGDVKKNEDIVSSENDDREKVYAAIAKKQNTTAELVGKRRAIQIAEKASPGEWLKDETGKWYQKK